MPTQSEHHSHGAAPFPWPQLVVLVVGFLLLLYALFGFWVSGFGSSVDPVPGSRYLLGVEVNQLRNAVHMAIGVIGAACAARLPAARAFGWVLMVVSLVEAGFGVVALLAPAADPLGMNLAAVVVALVTAAIGLVVAAVRARSEAPYGRLQAGTERVGRRMMRMNEQP